MDFYPCEGRKSSRRDESTGEHVMAPQEASFLLIIQETFSPKYLNLNPDEVAVLGRLVGTMNIEGDVDVDVDVDIIGFSHRIQKAKLIRIDTRGVVTSYILRGVTQKDIHQRGQVMTLPDTLQPKTTFLADVVFHEHGEKIRQQPFQGLLRYFLHIYGADVFSTFTLPLGKTELLHGDQFSVKITLNDPLALEVGLYFGIGRLLGAGVITQVLE